MENFDKFTTTLEDESTDPGETMLTYLEENMKLYFNNEKLFVELDFGHVSFEELDEVAELLRLSGDHYYDKPIFVDNSHLENFFTHFDIARTHKDGEGLEAKDGYLIECFISHLYSRKRDFVNKD